MNLKTIFKFGVLMLLPGLLLASCQKAGGEAQRARVRFRVNTPSSVTKAAVTPNEDNITCLDLVAFRVDDGSLDGTAHQSGASLTTVSGQVTAGVPLNCYVIANAPDGAFAGIGTESAFLSALSRLDESTAASLVMTGKVLSITVTPENSDQNVDISRLGCKVSVGEVAMSAGYYSGLGPTPSVTIGRIALVNVVGTIPYSAVPSAEALWYNRRGLEGGQPAIVDDMVCTSSGAAITGASPVAVNAALYCLPNPTDNSVNSGNDGGTWSIRNTRIAVEIIVNGNPEWYPVTLPAMGCNKHYRINRLTILGPGANSPDIPVERTDLAFTVSVNTWNPMDVPINFE